MTKFLDNPAVKIGVTALAAYAIVALIQRKAFAIPVVGEYLPR